MSSARKYMALALASCLSKQYEEAGVFLAQAAKEEDAAELAEQLGSDAVEKPAESVSAEEGLGADEEKDLDWGEVEDDVEEEVDEDEEAVSSVTRRKSTSLFQIGKILSASMSSVEEDEDEDEDAEADPDFMGESLIPASFSSVKVKSLVVTSPIKLKV